MFQDFLVVMVWWFSWLVFGGIGFVWTRRLFASWHDQGYAMGKIFGVIGVTFLAWLLGMAKLIPFSNISIYLAMIVFIFLGVIVNKRLSRSLGKINFRPILFEEGLFLVLLLIWSFVKGHEPTINGLEKFMDYGFMKSILESKFFPPADMWYAGKHINYYYFGHLFSAVVTKFSGINLSYTFNLMLATLFALTGLMGGSIAMQILSKFDIKLRWLGSIIIVYILLLGGNLHTIYSWTKGYSVDNPPPFWEIWGKVPDTYWYPNATRFIPWTIHEFPAYSFVVSDIHGHVLDIPIVLLLIGLLLVTFIDEEKRNRHILTIVTGFVIGTAFMTNALDGLIYVGLFVLMFLFNDMPKNWRQMNVVKLKPILMMFLTFVLTVLPFVLTFKSFVNGVAINCPPESLQNTRFGIVVFEEASKCQRSPVWMILILWGFFIYGGTWLFFLKEGRNKLETGMLLISLFCLGLIIFPEFFYFRDIYPQHFRSNTMFKLGYQVFILMTFVSIYTLIKGIKKRSYLGILGMLPLLYLVFVYPNFSVKGYFGKIDIENYKGLDGTAWIKQNYPENYALLYWMSINIPIRTQPVIVEASGDSYTEFNMISTFSGMPTVAGWLVHEWLWREGYSPIAERAEEVRSFYEDIDILSAKNFIDKYHVKYIVVSDFERQKYRNINLIKIESLARPVFTSGGTSLYQVI